MILHSVACSGSKPKVWEAANTCVTPQRVFCHHLPRLESINPGSQQHTGPLGEGGFLQLSCSTLVNMEKSMTDDWTNHDREKKPREVVSFFRYSPDNTKGSISNRSIRLNIQLLLWMMRVLMVVRLNCSSCGSLYLSWGCCSWSRSLTRCG